MSCIVKWRRRRDSGMVAYGPDGEVGRVVPVTLDTRQQWLVTWSPLAFGSGKARRPTWEPIAVHPTRAWAMATLESAVAERLNHRVRGEYKGTVVLRRRWLSWVMYGHRFAPNPPKLARVLQPAEACDSQLGLRLKDRPFPSPVRE